MGGVRRPGASDLGLRRFPSPWSLNWPTGSACSCPGRQGRLIARGSIPLLWISIVVLATLSTVVLSLDSTAVLLTPVALALAAKLQLDRAQFAYTTDWLAHTASLVLPMFGPANLLAVHVLRLNAPRFAQLRWPAAVTAIAVTVAGLVVIFRRSLCGRYTPGGHTNVADRPLLVLAKGV